MSSNHDDSSFSVSVRPSSWNVAKRLKVASVICLTFIVVEVTGGLMAGSLTVLSDAAHLLADLAGFGVALVASHLASLPATQKHTFGLKRVEALAALFSVSSLVLVSIVLAVEATRRLWILSSSSNSTTEENVMVVNGKLMTLIASIGVAVNVALALVLGEEGHVHLPGAAHDHHHDHHDCEEPKHTKESSPHHNHQHVHDCEKNHPHEEEALLTHVQQQEPSSYNSTSTASLGHDHSHHDHSHHDHSHHDPCEESSPKNNNIPKSPSLLKNINLHAAYLHVLGDLLMSLGVVVAGVVIWFQPTWHIVDPICTILFCGVVLYSTIEVFRSSLSVLLEEVPPHIELSQLESDIDHVRGVTNTHCLHVWSVSHGSYALSVHVKAVDPQQALQDIGDICQRYKIDHATIQTTSSLNGQACVTCTTTQHCDSQACAYGMTTN